MNRAVFLDRDNTLIHAEGDIVHPDEVRLITGAASAVASLRGLGYRIVVVSNQTGVAHGRLTEADVDAVNRRIAELVQRNSGATIDGFYYCPYHPEATLEPYRVEHSWRKPAPGMLKQAAADFQLDLEASWMVGDAPRDVAAGRAAGARTVLLQPDAAEPAALQVVEDDEAAPDFVAGSLIEAVRLIAQRPSTQPSEGAPVISTSPSASAVTRPDSPPEEDEPSGHPGETFEPPRPHSDRPADPPHAAAPGPPGPSDAESQPSPPAAAGRSLDPAGEVPSHAITPPVADADASAGSVSPPPAAPAPARPDPAGRESAGRESAPHAEDAAPPPTPRPTPHDGEPPADDAEPERYSSGIPSPDDILDATAPRHAPQPASRRPSRSAPAEQQAGAAATDRGGENAGRADAEDAVLINVLRSLQRELKTRRADYGDFSYAKMGAVLCQMLAAGCVLFGMINLGDFDAFIRWMVGASFTQMLVITLLILHGQR